MTDNLRVDTNDLRAKADTIDGVQWAGPGEQPPIQWPSSFQTSIDAVGNLAKAAQSVWEYQNWGFNESKRLSQALYHVAKAYDTVDLRAEADIKAGGPISSGPVNPDANTLPKPSHPNAPGAPGKIGHGHGDPEEVEEALTNGDQGAALQHVAEFWRTTGHNLHSASEHFKVRIQHWEGAAAEVAYGKFNDFGGWCESLAGTWEQLAGEADRIYEAHQHARAAHTPIYDQWMALKKQLETAADDQKPAIMQELLKQYAQSEHVRAKYEADATIERVQPPEPHDGDIQTPVYTNGDPRRPATPASNDEQPQPGTPGGGGEPGSPGGGSPTSTPPSMPVSPASADTPQPTVPQQQPAAAQSGGSPSNGSGSQGGSPSGGAGGGMPGGIPAAAKASPNLPKGPSLKPASAGGHGGGGASGGGGGRGPMQPAVTGSAVAPSHGAAAHGAQAGHAGPTAPAGAGGGGGAPMGGQGGHGQGGGKERRRTPGLAPDEELYKEDREWTEGVIGHRKRTNVQDGKDKK